MAKKRFGQNFLVDSSVIERMLLAISPKKEEHFIEIGPGLGALTRPLLGAGVKLEVIEIDRDLISGLQKISPNLTVHAKDALSFDFSLYKKIRVVGNLPYNISSPLLLHCFEYIDHIQDMHFMLQKEVVDRLSAEPGTKDYGRLTIVTQYFCKVEKLFEVPPEAFDPAPKVTSAVFRLIPKENREPIKLKNLELVTQHAFSQRRKTLRNSLAKLFSEADLLRLGIDPTKRAEELRLSEYIVLASNIQL